MIIIILLNIIIVIIFSIAILGIKNKNAEISQVVIITSTPRFIAKIVTPQKIYDLMNTPIAKENEITEREIEITTTPETQEIRIKETQEIKMEETQEIKIEKTEEYTRNQELQQLQQTYIISREKGKQELQQPTMKLSASNVGLPNSVLEVWFVVKTMMIDLGLWQPLQYIFTIMLVIIFVFIILRRLEI